MFNWLKKLFKKEEKSRKKIGLALGSGGAKGMAHIGFLKVMEENGIEFDIVAGTSIGSIVGAFYCEGYSSDEMLALFQNLNFDEIKNKTMLRMDGKDLENVLIKNLGDLSFEELKKPLAVIVTNSATMQEKVCYSGSVCKALSASSAYPPFFKPVNIDGESYIDGAFTNAIPANVVKEMGADVVIGIDLSYKIEEEKKKGGFISDLLPQLASAIIPQASENSKRGYDYADIMLQPALQDYRAVMYKRADEMFEIGYTEGLKRLEEIKALIEEITKNEKRKK